MTASRVNRLRALHLLGNEVTEQLAPSDLMLKIEMTGNHVRCGPDGNVVFLHTILETSLLGSLPSRKVRMLIQAAGTGDAEDAWNSALLRVLFRSISIPPFIKRACGYLQKITPC